MDVSIEVELGKFAELSNIADNMDAAMQEVIDEVIQAVFEESQNLVPVDTGALKSSGQIISGSNDEGDSPNAYIEYGNDTVTYAVEVHENLQTPHKDPTQAKYLEVPMAKEGQKFEDLVAQRLQKLFSTGE